MFVVALDIWLLLLYFAVFGMTIELFINSLMGSNIRQLKRKCQVNINIFFKYFLL